MSINFKKDILLTGAGFSANFGAPLAREMWSKILNNPKIEQLPKVKEKLLSNFDFEDVYSQVARNQSFTEDEKNIFQGIILNAYQDMDETLRSFCQGFPGVDWSGVANFLELFSGNINEPGAHFTLNQDLLLERARYALPLGMYVPHYHQYREDFLAQQIDTSKPITLYSDAELNEFIEKHLPSTGNKYYIKLHGSHGWLSHTGSQQMVLGKNKAEDIEKEPILKYYFDLFKQAINRDGVRLFIIGYSFRDEHINNCILEAINEHKLKLYVISPEDPEILKNRLEGKPDQPAMYEVSPNKKIWESIHAYFPYKLTSIFPEHGPRSRGGATQVAKNLKALLQ